MLVLSALALVALIGGRFAARIDALREQTSTLAAHARATLQAGNAVAAGLYWMSTHETGPAGFGPALQPSLHADDRAYVLDIGGELRLQDLRGLYPLNALERAPFSRLLQALGLDTAMTDTYIDVLLDYEDTDNLKRLNGAEAADYAVVGLPPPRNDWLLSVRELDRMPHWRDKPEFTAALEPWVSTSRTGFFNPNTAPRAVLQAMLPQARPEQLELLETMRAAAPFLTGDAARKATGLALDGDDKLFHGGEQYRLTVWAAGMPQTLQYNVLLLPGGRVAPWLISEVHPAARPAPSKTPDRATAFPLAFAPAGP